MWRVFYNQNNGDIKYQINVGNANPEEGLTYVDFAEQQLIHNKRVDLETLELVEATPYVSGLTPPVAKSKVATKSWTLNKG